jgi:hypothetical protein
MTAQVSEAPTPIAIEDFTKLYNPIVPTQTPHEQTATALAYHASRIATWLESNAPINAFFPQMTQRQFGIQPEAITDMPGFVGGFLLAADLYQLFVGASPLIPLSNHQPKVNQQEAQKMLARETALLREASLLGIQAAAYKKRHTNSDGTEWVKDMIHQMAKQKGRELRPDVNEGIGVALRGARVLYTFFDEARKK